MNSAYIDPDLSIAGHNAIMKQGLTVFLYGGVGTRKTTWAGLGPKPLFLSIGPEGGDDSLAMLPHLYGVQQPPVYHITSSSMMKEKVALICRDYVKMDINTVVIDSITYYFDLWIAKTSAEREKNSTVKAKMDKKGEDAATLTMRDWGVLSMHIRDLAMALHKTPLNVVWIALEKEIRNHDENTGTSTVVAVEPYIKGEQTIKLPGLCKMIIYAKNEFHPDPTRPGGVFAHPVFYTSPTRLTSIVRHKYGQMFPEGYLCDEQRQSVPTWDLLYKRVGNFIYRT